MTILWKTPLLFSQDIQIPSSTATSNIPNLYTLSPCNSHIPNTHTYIPALLQRLPTKPHVFTPLQPRITCTYRWEQDVQLHTDTCHFPDAHWCPEADVEAKSCFSNHQYFTSLSYTLILGGYVLQFSMRECPQGQTPYETSGFIMNVFPPINPTGMTLHPTTPSIGLEAQALATSPVRMGDPEELRKDSISLQASARMHSSDP